MQVSIDVAEPLAIKIDDILLALALKGWRLITAVL
jgi:hypothetical protein